MRLFNVLPRYRIGLGVMLILMSFLVWSGADALTIISPIVELQGDAGTTQRGLVKVYNETDADQVLTSSIEPIKTSDENGLPVFGPLDAAQNAVAWFKLDTDSLVLKSKQVAVIPFTVTIPAHARSGGYYVAIFWQPQIQAGNNQTAVSVKGKVGTLVLLKVNGDLIEQGELLDFTVNQKISSIVDLPLTFAARFSNTGNIHLTPQGSITLHNGISRDIVLPLNADQRLVLPSSVRRFEVVWGQSPQNGAPWQRWWQGLVSEWHYLPIGPYAATIQLHYGAGGAKTVSSQIHFWLMPWHLLTAGLGLVILIIIFFILNAKVNSLKRAAKHQEHETES